MQHIFRRSGFNMEFGTKDDWSKVLDNESHCTFHATKLKLCRINVMNMNENIVDDIDLVSNKWGANN